MGILTLKQAAAWCGGTVDKKYENVTFFGASNDTRTLSHGQLFVVLQAARDGHDFISAAMEKGAAAVLCSRRMGDYPAIYVDDPRIALGQIAAGERQRLGAKVIGITGSVGKSTTKEMIASVLETTYKIGKTPVNHNNDIGMPMAILGMEEGIQIAVLEMGMNHFREMAYLSKIGRPDLAVIVNIGTAHIEFLGSQEGIRQAKLEILEGMPRNGKLFLNGDDPFLCNPEQTIRQSITYFGTRGECHVRCTEVQEHDGAMQFQVTSPVGNFPVTLGQEGMHYVIDAMAAIAIGLELGVTPENIRAALSHFHNLSGRQETLKVGKLTIIKDCYNAGPESMDAALKVLGAKPGRRIAVLGDMLELGDCANAEHYKVGRTAAANADMVFAFGSEAPQVVVGCVTGGMDPAKARAFESREEMALQLSRAAKDGDVMLFKGSHGMHLEKVLETFTELYKNK